MSEITLSADLEQLDEQRLIDMLGAANPSVITAIFEQYAMRMVRNLQRTYAMRHEDALDVVQEAFQLIYEKLLNGDRIDVDRSLSGWLWSLTRQTSIQVHRREHALKRGGGTTFLPIECAASLPASGLMPDEQAELKDEDADTKELLAEVQDAICELEPEDQDLMRMKFYENLKHQQIAEMLGISIHQTQYRLRRAQETLRRLLSQHMDN